MKRLLTILSVLFITSLYTVNAQSNVWSGSSNVALDEGKPQVMLFPNPLYRQDFTVKSSVKPSKIVVINAIGQTVFNNDKIDYSFNNEYEVNLDQPEKGLYLVKVDFPNQKSIVKKLLIK